jgi:hypothetical protein
MVNRLKLNEKALRDAEPKPGISYQIFDTEVIGFAARIQASGARAFTIDYRHAGRQRRMNIGRWPEWSVTAARERAKELRRTIDEGNDPLATWEDFHEAPRIKDMIDRYIAEHLPKLAKNNAADQTSMLKKMVEPNWGNKLVTEITKLDVAKFLDFVAEGRPRPSKEKPNNRARNLEGHKPTPTQAINILPNLYTRLGQIGLFRFEGVTQRSIVIEQYQGVLSLLPSVPLGAPATVGNREGRSMRSFALPWIPHDDVILPSDIQGQPALGLSDAADPLVEVMSRKLQLMRRKHAQTREYMEMNALRGIVKDGAGTTLYNYFTEFGLTQISVDFVFGTAGTNV